MSIRYIPRNSIGKSYRIPRYITVYRYIPRNSIDKSYRVPRYITDRQNYIGFTYKRPINLLYLFTVHGFLGNSANTDLIRQAKGEPPTPTLKTNKQTTLILPINYYNYLSVIVNVIHFFSQTLTFAIFLSSSTNVA